MKANLRQLPDNRKSARTDTEPSCANILSVDVLDLVHAAGSTTIPNVQINPLLAQHDMPHDEERKP